jgi:hypothetical protein
MVNFSLSKSSLQAMILDLLLHKLAPETSEKRKDILKVQGEYQARLRKLEGELLQTLYSAQGNILDDDRVMRQLEVLQEEALDIQKKSIETQSVLAEIEHMIEVFRPYARKFTDVYFSLEQLHILNEIYRPSLESYLEVFKTSLASIKCSSTSNISKALQTLEKTLFKNVYLRTSLGLYQKDKPALLFNLVSIKQGWTSNEIALGCIKFILGSSWQASEISGSRLPDWMPTPVRSTLTELFNILPSLGSEDSLIGKESLWRYLIVSPKINTARLQDFLPILKGKFIL